MAVPTTVDVHSHFFPESYLKVIEDAGAPFSARVDRSNPKRPSIVIGPTRICAASPTTRSRTRPSRSRI
jgi:hypothetical protein